jgi:hypothetical protein
MKEETTINYKQQHTIITRIKNDNTHRRKIIRASHLTG